MSERQDFDLDGIKFGRSVPLDLSKRFDEVQRLRAQHYQREMHERSPSEIDHYVGRTTLLRWVAPNTAVGKIAKEGQQRMEPTVAYAYDERSNALLGLSYFALNVSSKLEPLLKKLHLPKSFAYRVGRMERDAKVDREHYYVWGSEHVEADGHTDLAPLLVSLGIEAYSPELAGTWYPWAEEDRLFSELNNWGYDLDMHTADSIEGEQGFGLGTQSTDQYRYVVDHLGIVTGRILGIPGAREALDYAHESLPN